MNKLIIIILCIVLFLIAGCSETPEKYSLLGYKNVYMLMEYINGTITNNTLFEFPFEVTAKLKGTDEGKIWVEREGNDYIIYGDKRAKEIYDSKIRMCVSSMPNYYDGNNCFPLKIEAHLKIKNYTGENYTLVITDKEFAENE